MQDFDLHVHSTFSDGADDPETIVKTAIELGLSCIGISDHSYEPGAEEWCMREDALPAYRQAIAALKEKYADKIIVLCGIEQDLYSPQPPQGFDYVIGSVHFLRHNNELAAVDEAPSFLQEAAENWFDGDMYSLTELYYQEMAKVAERTRADYIGHFDLITKFNEHGTLFDPEHPRYRAAACAAADTLLQYKKPFEINFGAIARGYRTSPYPSADLRAYIVSHGGTFILSSDSHAASTIGGGFAAPIRPGVR